MYISYRIEKDITKLKDHKKEKKMYNTKRNRFDDLLSKVNSNYKYKNYEADTSTKDIINKPRPLHDNEQTTRVNNSTFVNDVTARDLDIIPIVKYATINGEIDGMLNNTKTVEGNIQNDNSKKLI